MKKLILFIALVACWNIISAQTLLFVNQPKDSVVRHDPRMQQFDFVPGEILIKFKDDVAVSNQKVSGIITLGLKSVDAVFLKYQVNAAEKLFPNEKKLKNKTIIRGFNGQEFEQPSLHNIYKLSLPRESNLYNAIEALKADESVMYAELNYIMSITEDKALTPPMTEAEASKWQALIERFPFPFDAPLIPAPLPSPKSTPNDPLYPQQWYIPAVHADEVWDTITSDSTQVIAILDTGVDWLHPDLLNKIWVNSGEIAGNGIDDDTNGKIDDVRGWDWINNDNNPTDDNSHGTHVAGIAAAEANNGIGISGVSQWAKIMPLKVFQSSGRGDAATITQGIIYAKNKGATVLNMSFGSYAQSLAMGDALASAYSTTILVAASGNDRMDIGDCPPGGPFYPAALSYVLGVMAPDGSFSNGDCTGPTFSLSAELNNYEMKAPGTNILSTIPNGNYRVYQGTSMAAPVLSGSLAMYKKLFPTESQEMMWVKFIQTTTTFFNIDAAINCDPVPEVRPISRTMVDTIAGDDYDGRVDAGETIQIWFTARNTGGQCDSTWFKIRFHEFEDTTLAQILKPLSFIGSMSPYATLTSQFDPMKIHFSPDIAHDRDVVFDLLFWFKNSQDTAVQQVVFTIENGLQLAGVLDTLMILYPNRLYLVNSSFKVGVNGTLIIKPGTKMLIYPGRTIPISGRLIADGTSDSLISIVGYGGGVGTVFSYRNDVNIRNHVSYCKFENLSWPLSSDNYMNPASVYNCVFLTDFIGIVDSVINNFYYSNSEAIYTSRSGYVYKNNFIAPSTSSNYYYNGNCPYAMYTGGYQLINNNFVNFRMPPVQYQNTDQTKANAWISEYSKPTLSWNGTFWVEGRQILEKHNTSYQSTSDFEYIQHQYWGTNNPSKIEGFITDFMEQPTWPKAVFLPNLTSPPDSCHAIVWKILVNGADPQDEYLDPVGIGPQKFEVYFNRPMDHSIQPQLTFGVRYPFTQQTISDSGQWSPDYKIWTAYKNIQLFTGDGINRLRVSGAKDVEGWEIPVEDMRFEFVIAAAGSASTDFTAQAGIGKVYLEWNNAGIQDLLGFNMYRFKNLTDTTYSNPVLINTSLITDTVYTDFAVIPNEHYWYYYKVVNTDFRESDSSSFVNAVPYNAPNGDANGDMAVNVLDITSIVAYMLNQNPQPFLFDAADVNGDNQINVLDIIGAVQIIMGAKSAPLSTLISINPTPAYISIEEGQLILESIGQVSALQFNLVCDNPEEVILASSLPGFEFASAITGINTITGILFNLTQKPIPDGIQKIVRIESTEKQHFNIAEITGGDANGDYVPILKEKEIPELPETFNLSAIPNPFSSQTVIHFYLSESALVKAEVFDISGKKICTLIDNNLLPGHHSYSWNGKDAKGRQQPSGIFFLHFEAKIPDQPIVKDIKLIYFR